MSISPSKSNKKSFENISNFFPFEVFTLQTIGALSFDEPSILPNWPVFSSKLLNYLYKGFLLFVIGQTTIALTLKIYMHYASGNNDLSDLSDPISHGLMYIYAIYQIICFYIKQNECKNLLEFCNRNFRMRSAPGLTFVTAQDSVKMARNFTIFWFLTGLSAGVFWDMVPILRWKRTLPLPQSSAWYPFNAMAPGIFEIMFFLQSIAEIAMGLSYSMTSGLFVSTVIIICGQFDILYCSLKNLHTTARLTMGGMDLKDEILNEQQLFDPENEEINSFLFTKNEVLCTLNDQPTQKSENLTYNLRAALKNCVEHHKIIIEASKKFADFFSWIFVGKIAMVTIELVFELYSIVNVANASYGHILVLAGYAYLTAAEWLIYSYFSECLALHSTRVGEAILRSPWYLYSKELRKELLILLPNALRPVAIRGGSFFFMNIDIFLLVMRTAFSYYTLLKNLNNENA